MTSNIQLSEYDKKRNLIIPERITAELAYLCGVFAGDGSLNYRAKKYEYYLRCVGNPKDEKAYYHDIIYPLFKKVFGTKINLVHHDKGTTYGFSIYSKSLFRYLTETIKLPSGKKYAHLHIPKVFLKNKTFLTAFIRGVFDTDGCMTFKKKTYPVISVSSKSRRFMEQISMGLNSLGLGKRNVYTYKIYDSRFIKGYSYISRIEFSGYPALKRWLTIIGFSSTKHLGKIEKYGKKS